MEQSHVLAPVAPPVTYDRAAALAWARAHWDRPCADGYVAGEFGAQSYRKVPDGTRFVHDAGLDGPEHALLPDGTAIPWSQLDDCTHFISSCLGRPPGGGGGGLPVPCDFSAPGPYGILGADRFVRKLVARRLVEVIPVSDKNAPGLERIAPGDLVGYFRVEKSRYGHLALYLGDGKIACHTYCRSDDATCTWDNRFDLGRNEPDWQWHLLRVTAPSPAEAPHPG